jgi:putative sigma-54 modulation protein
MQINVKGRNLEVTDALRSYLDKKLTKLEKHFHDLKEANVTLSIHRGMHIVEVQLEGDGILLRSEERRGTDMYGSIDQVVEKLEVRARKFKGKRVGRAIEEGPKAKEIIKQNVMAEAFGGIAPEESLQSAEEELDTEKLPMLVRLKKFEVQSMPPEEAALQMELLHHGFYVFRNSHSDTLNVVYKREDGDYGLLVPV